MVEAVIGDVQAGLSITAVRGGRGASAAVLNAVAGRLRMTGHVVVALAGADLVSPTVVAAAVLDACGEHPHRGDGTIGQLTQQLRQVLSGTPLSTVVVLIDDADGLPAGVYRFINRLLTLARDGTVKVRIVLFGVHAPWPELHLVEHNLWSTFIIPPSIRPEAAGTVGQRPMRAAAQHHASPPRAEDLDRRRPSRAWRLAKISLACASVLLAVMLAPRHWLGTRPPTDYPATQQAFGGATPVVPDPEPVSSPPPVQTLEDQAATKPSVAAQSDTPPETMDPQPFRETAPLDDTVPPAPVRHPPPLGLVFLAQPGDTLMSLYNKLYRGSSTPSFAEVAAMNPAPVRPGTLLIFPGPLGSGPVQTNGSPAVAP